ncbi:uncharacterized protein [Clytia hemisphaerica]|uniref:uncharacterized protein n=1 Tax=Clytia hemisphaerica TaxID=252671 RepID=UPI0034D5DED4
MLAEKNPVVIVVCDENEDKENNNIHKNEHFIEDEENFTNLPSFHTNNIINNNNIPNIEASQQQYTPLIMTSSITGHPSLTKNNSFPLDNNNRKDLLCVPGEFSLNLPVADEQSLYGSMYSIDSSISCHSADEMRCDCFLRKTRGDSFLSIMEPMPENTMFTGMSMKCASAHNLLSTGSAGNSPMPKIRGTRSHGNHNNNHLRGCHLHGKQQSADDAAFPHKSLKRTISVPLKTSKEQLTDSKTRKDGESRRSPNTSQVNYFNFFSPKVWKRSFLKMNDEKGASRFSLRRTFSLRSSTSANNGEGGQIAFPTKHKKKTQKYKIVEGKDGTSRWDFI